MLSDADAADIIPPDVVVVVVVERTVVVVVVDLVDGLPFTSSPVSDNTSDIFVIKIIPFTVLVLVNYNANHFSISFNLLVTKISLDNTDKYATCYWHSVLYNTFLTQE